MPEENDFVLLVEDTLTQAMLYQHSFEKAGIKTIVAKSPKKALTILETSKPILVISDVNMPEINGYQLCSSIKANDTTSDITVVLISSVLNSEDIFEIVNCGADDFILKTLEPEAITKHLLWSISQTKQQKDASDKPEPFESSVWINGKQSKMRLDPKRSANLIFSLYNTICSISKNY